MPALLPYYRTCKVSSLSLVDEPKMETATVNARIAEAFRINPQTILRYFLGEMLYVLLSRTRWKSSFSPDHFEPFLFFFFPFPFILLKTNITNYEVSKLLDNKKGPINEKIFG